MVVTIEMSHAAAHFLHGMAAHMNKVKALPDDPTVAYDCSAWLEEIEAVTSAALAEAHGDGESPAVRLRSALTIAGGDVTELAQGLTNGAHPLDAAADALRIAMEIYDALHIGSTP